jgi:hypothetical protein
MLTSLPPRAKRGSVDAPTGDEYAPEARDGYPPDLPRLERDPFEWTPKELEEACRIARSWLTKTKKKGAVKS